MLRCYETPKRIKIEAILQTIKTYDISNKIRVKGVFSLQLLSRCQLSLLTNFLSFLSFNYEAVVNLASQLTILSFLLS